MPIKYANDPATCPHPEERLELGPLLRWFCYACGSCVTYDHPRRPRESAATAPLRGGSPREIMERREHES